MSSPLTRALHTALIGFATRGEGVPLVVNYFIREVGSAIPENQPRPIDLVLRDLSSDADATRLEEVDYKSLMPANWPEDAGGRSEKAEKMDEFVEWLCGRPETKIAVVCHHNVIQALLKSKKVDIENAVPIRCSLCSESGVLVWDA